MSEHRLSEIVIERPRTGMRISSTSLNGFKKNLHKLTVEASEDGLLSPYIIKVRNGSKRLSDHLAPLRRFLKSKVGEPWNQVYSELCQRLDPSTMAGRHVIGHLWHYVEQHVELIDDIPYRKPYLGYRSRQLISYRDQFYIHPETGILCLAKSVPRKQKTSPPTDVVMIDKYHQYCKINEIWYLVTFEDFPPPPTKDVTDIIRGLIDRDSAMCVGGRRIYAVSKQQCNKKQIRFILNQLVQR
ncbi:hypothetical protein Cylst_2342 [Cylindrospermum stagnale PCC 7417]|uniref:Uncharacterized protein n=1 Tax=Cylindrospermum stagnale PCC 7417 TaxID=56107 RepID=K9WW39_9NOST|nr:hypothetical protein [Cylindrospermum stagnale]AFZ24570.1 hypothetical protein Cylst_2342 [Cylindrospermum stagnale PCC 7417]